MSKSLAFTGAIATALLVASAGTASAQSLPADYLGSAGEVLPGSVTGSLPGYASGPLGSAATAVCNVGSVAGSVGVGLPAEIDPVCKVIPAVAESGDLFMLGDYGGSVSALVGAVPFVGGSLARMVPTQSAADAVEGSVGQLPTDSVSGLVPGS